MDKIREKLTQYRADIEAQNNLSQEYREKVKALELESLNKDHELLSLRTRVRNLEELLKKVEDGLLKATEDFHTAESKADEAQNKTEALELELTEKEQLHEELDAKYKAAKTEMDELARQFEDL